MSIIKKSIIIIFMATFIGQANAAAVKKIGTNKNWEKYVIN